MFWFVPSVCVRSHVLLIWAREAREGRGKNPGEVCCFILFVRFVVYFVCDVLTV